MNLKIFSINLFSTFTALQYALIIYYGSIFLSKIIHVESVWMIYSFAAILTLSLQLFTNKLLRRININKLIPKFTILAAANLFILFIMQYLNFPLWILKGFIPLHFALYIAFSQTLFMLASVMLEDLSKDQETGSLRGALLSLTNSGYLIAPFLAQVILKLGKDYYLFLTSAIICIIIYLIFQIGIKSLPTITIHKETSIRKDFRKIWQNTDIRNILILQTMIEMFFATFVIYMPLKLTNLGIPISVYLGIILPLSLTPYLFIPTWLGHLEDKVKNEKFILYLNFIIMTIVLITFSISKSNFFIFWAIMIFISRISASAIETSTSSYLFKKINVKNTTVITLYNSSQPIAYFLTPMLLGSVYFLTKDFNLVFITTAMFMLMAIYLIFQISPIKIKEEEKERNLI